MILQMRQHSEQRQKRLGKLIDLWNNLVPPELAAQVIVEGLRRGVLHVSADASSTSYALDRALRDLQSIVA